MLVKTIGHDRYLINNIETDLIEKTNGLLDIPGFDPQYDHEGNLEGVIAHRSHIPAIVKTFPDLEIPKYPRQPTNSKVKLNYELRDYQIEAIEFARERSGCLLLHDMGMGKTPMALMAADFPALVLVPTPAITVWENEALDAGLDIQILQGTKPNPKLLSNKADLFILTYGSAYCWLPYFKALGVGPKLRTIIADEAQYIARMGTQAAKALRGVAHDQTILSTATPVPNRLASFWGLLDLAARKAFGKHFQFRERYCGAVPGQWGGWQDVLATNTQELADRVAEIAIRRTWNEPGFAHLRPSLVREVENLEIPLDHKVRLNNEAIKHVFARLKTSGSNAQTINYLTQLRQKLGEYKAEICLEEGIFRRNPDERKVIFCWHKDVVRAVAKRLMEDVPECPVDILSGVTTRKQRSAILDEWEYGDREPRILVATLATASEAVNLVTANHAYFVEFDWAPRRLVQAEARHHRPGNKNPTVYSHYITLKGTLEDRITSALLDKVIDQEFALGRDGQRDQIMALFEEAEENTFEDPLESLAHRILAA